MEYNLLIKTLILAGGIEDDAIQYGRSCEKNHLGKVLRYLIAALEVAVFCERVEDEEVVCEKVVFAGFSGSGLVEEREEEGLKRVILIVS